MNSSYRSIFEDIISRLNDIEIDEIKSSLNPLLGKYKVQCPIFNPGAFLYRGRLMNSTFNKELGIKKDDLIYPPAEKAPLGRLNRAGQPLFYCSMNKSPVFFEIPGIQVGDEVVLTFWKTTSKMLLNNIGYTDFIFRQLGAVRPPPKWGPQIPSEATDTKITLQERPPEEIKAAISEDEYSETRELFSEFFARKIEVGERQFYKLTIAIGEMHLGTVHGQEIQFAGILYPSIRMWANADNAALLPWFVDTHLEFRKALHIRVKSRTSENSIEIDRLDAALEFDEDGKLKWLGRLPAWTVPPRGALEMVAVDGQDEDGDYEEGNGRIAHWTAVDTATRERVFPK